MCSSRSSSPRPPQIPASSISDSRPCVEFRRFAAEAGVFLRGFVLARKAVTSGASMSSSHVMSKHVTIWLSEKLLNVYITRLCVLEFLLSSLRSLYNLVRYSIRSIYFWPLSIVHIQHREAIVPLVFHSRYQLRSARWTPLQPRTFLTNDS